MPRVALVQRPPVFLDRDQTIEQAAAAVAGAAAAGATLIAFPETYVPGYPDWIWRLRPWPDVGITAALHDRLAAAAVDLVADHLAPVREAARHAGVTVVIGINERDSAFSRTTLYNTVVIIGPGGEILNRHRKLIPTNPERMVWGIGDASGLRAVDTPAGRLGTLICWENYMPLARFVLYAQGVELYVAPTWDHGEHWLTAMQYIAREGRCWVLGCGVAMQARDVPADLPGRDQIYDDDDEWLNTGDSVVVDPAGCITAGPLSKERSTLYADCDPTRVIGARRSLDISGHCGRPDIFNLVVDRTARAPVSFIGDEPLPPPPPSAPAAEGATAGRRPRRRRT